MAVTRLVPPPTRCLLRDLGSIARWATTGAPFLPSEEDRPVVG